MLSRRRGTLVIGTISSPMVTNPAAARIQVIERETLFSVTCGRMHKKKSIIHTITLSVGLHVADVCHQCFDRASHVTFACIFPVRTKKQASNLTRSTSKQILLHCASDVAKKERTSEHKCSTDQHVPRPRNRSPATTSMAAGCSSSIPNATNSTSSI